MPGLLLFCFWFSLKSIWSFRTKGSPRFPATWGCLFIVIISFLAVVYPYISNSKKTFGRYFYNINSTFYFWYDSWEDVKSDTAVYESIKWPAVSEDKLPSFSRYLREHSYKEIIDRFAQGAATIFRWSKSSFGFIGYMLAYFLFLILLVVLNRQYFFGLFQHNIFIVLFIFSYFVSAFFLYAWYTPIGSGLRFALALFLPFMFVCSWATAKAPLISFGKDSSLARIPLVTLFNISIFFILLLDIYVIMSATAVKLYGGS